MVLSMALTPALAELGKVAGEWLEDFIARQQAADQPLLDVMAEVASNKTLPDAHKVGGGEMRPFPCCEGLL